MTLPAIYFFQFSRYTKKVLHIHTGFNDHYLLWMAGGRVKEIAFIKTAS